MPWIIATCLALLPFTAGALDFAGERAWAAALEKTPLAAERVWLEADGIAFPALWRKGRRRNTMGAVILLHGRGEHPAWPHPVEALRRALPERGWATLSIATPDQSPLSAALEQGMRRIQAALDFLSQRGMRNVALLGHDLGALTAAAFLAGREEPAPLRAVVFLAMPRLASPGSSLDGTALIPRIALPMLDVSPERLSPTQAAFRQARRSAAAQGTAPSGFAPLAPTPRSRGLSLQSTGNPGYRQVVIPAAGRDFSGREDWLAKIVSSWLNRVAPGVEVAR